MTVMKSRELGFAIFAALSLQATRTGCAEEQPRPAATTTNTTVNTTISDFVGDVPSPIRARSREMDFGGPDPSLQESATGLSEGRGKKKKKKKKKKIKIKNPSMNMLIGGSMMAAFVVIFTFVNMITVTLGKALFFTFIAKFLISVNWKSSESSSKKKSTRNDITVVMT
ncbi:uncharacterized protein LOC107883562 [Acyrthosiphon pisum]|uniref:Uncharacterized protein n=1 Tax=Acyrthosiphon pisum TaxID=7029 RepID=A0A8R2D360_ACYPI|nr:uncharacterized protein LOC107883562 [Acyrthosiphon pisum]|eukprot:XP_016659268.1 PREDICTED: uncharacterized protein LOC107883562 [Acyrthosiphon pisum]